ncbi:MAG TPA: TetR/AcrR family transcriptional regulator [Candidatus Angelobacter sp.]|jgi:AcrR family transcriptional regulator|nr:TetR/AcrR family transcriptional regulator [Candidatus Angelobacter sp.]
MALATPEIRPAGFPLNGRKAKPDLPENDFDRRMAMVLEHASRIFCEKGYEGASMRDLSRASGMSLAGLYHYFESKEELLYLIQKHAFTTIVERLRQRLAGCTGPEERIRIFIHNHLEYSLANKEAMKVLVHEDDTLKNDRGAEIATIKREYYRICLGLLEELRRVKGLQFSGRLALLSLFGMVNWIYTWHNPRIDPVAVGLAKQMGDIFLQGVLHASKTKPLNHTFAPLSAGSGREGTRRKTTVKTSRKEELAR